MRARSRCWAGSPRPASPARPWPGSGAPTSPAPPCPHSASTASTCPPSARPANRRRGSPGSIRVFEAEADLEAYLVVGDVAVHDLAPDLGHLEPVQVPQGLRGAVQGAVDGRLDSIRRGAHDLGDPI